MIDCEVEGSSGVSSDCGLDVAEKNIKNKLSSSPIYTSPIDDLEVAQCEWDAIQDVEPQILPSVDDTLEKKRSPSPPSTPVYAASVGSVKTTSPSHFSSLHSLQHGTPHQLSWQHSRQCDERVSPGAPHLSHPSPFSNGSICSLSSQKSTPVIDFDETWEYFTRQDMTHVKLFIKPCVERRGVSGLLRGVFGPRKLRPELLKERDLLFCVAQCPLSNQEPLHLQMLYTIYRKLTGTPTDCPRYGPHWDIIGFQGTDPSTDLRGVGLLGLVQMVALVTGEQSQQLAGDVLALSHDPHSQFPLMVLCLNVTRIALQALREGCLNKECNSRGNVRHVLNEFFAAVLYHIYHIWRTQRKCITDSGYLLKDAESYCKNNVRTVLQRLQQHLKTYASQHLV